MSDDETARREAALAAVAAYRASRAVIPATLEGKLNGLYIKTRRDDDLKCAIDIGLDGLSLGKIHGARREGRGLAILGGSGSGKSRSIRRALARHPLFPGFSSEDPDCNAVSVACKGSYTLKMLGIEIADAVCYPLSLNLNENVVWHKVRKQLKKKAKLVLHIDEVNSLLRKTTKPERERIADLFKSILNDKDWPIFLILSGTPRCREILNDSDPDGELERRIDWRSYDKLRLPADVKMITGQLEELCGIAGIAADKLEPTAVHRLIHAARYELGRASEIAVGAVKKAWESDREDLRMAHFTEQVAKQCAIGQNPFVADEWWKTKVMPRDNEDDDGEV